MRASLSSGIKHITFQYFESGPKRQKHSYKGQIKTCRQLKWQMRMVINGHISIYFFRRHTHFIFEDNPCTFWFMTLHYVKVKPIPQRNKQFISKNRNFTSKHIHTYKSYKLGNSVKFQFFDGWSILWFLSVVFTIWISPLRRNSSNIFHLSFLKRLNQNLVIFL